MQTYEYKAVPAPDRAKPMKGVRGADQRFALTMSETINAESAKGWAYMRADTLPVEERSMLGARRTVSRCVLIFRRKQDMAVAAEKSPAPRFQASRQSSAAPAVPEEPRLRAVPAEGQQPAPARD